MSRTYVSIVLKHRLQDKSASSLNRMARKVNLVWNYCNDAQKHTFETKWAWKDKWLSAEALEDLTAGSSKELDLPSPIIQKVCSHLWHTGQKNVDRPFCAIRFTTPAHPGVTQGLPSRS